MDKFSNEQKILDLNIWPLEKSEDEKLVEMKARVTQNAKVSQNFAPQAFFKRILQVILKSGLIFQFGGRLTVPGKAGRFT